MARGLTSTNANAVPPPNDGSGAMRDPGRRLPRAEIAHSRFVGLMKLILPIAAGIPVLLIFIWPEFRDDPPTFRLGPSKITIETVSGQMLVNARITGVDRNDNPYTVTAEGVVQGSNDADEIDLRNPKADITLDNQSWIALTAPSGRYLKQDQVLELLGGVNLFHDRGYEFRTENAVVDFANGAAFGEDPVDGQGPFGSIRSQGFLILDGGARVVFTGKARMILYPGAEGPGP